MIEGLRSMESVGSVLATQRAGTPVTAAKLLGQAPSTVYRALERLEKEIGMPLFERGPAGWRTTDIGERVARLAEAMETEIAAAERFVLGEGRGFPAPLRVSASDGMAEGYLAPLLARFARGKDMTIDLVVDNQFADLGRDAAWVTIQISTGAATGMAVMRFTPLSRSPRKHGSTPMPAPAAMADARLISVLAISAMSTRLRSLGVHHFAAV